MNALQKFFAELIGLFVDDWAFATAVLLWLLVNILVLPRTHLAQPLRAVALFFGLALILVFSAVRYARSRRNPHP